jgi:sigma-E factor negative regulatory protein RseB
LALAACASLAQGQPASDADALALLARIYEATEKLSYTGTFVYQQGNRSETSRIARVVDASGDTERIEVLDGTPREIVRTRDTVRCYLPDSQTVKVERRGYKRVFPALRPERISDLARNYVITRGAPERIAGFDCESVVLSPSDKLRYGYKLWADANTGMLLRSRTVNDKGETVEQFTFTQLAIGNVSRGKLKSRYAGRSWRVEDASAVPADLAASGWIVTEALPGFRKVTEVTRRLGESRPVGQIVYSDGLAAVSVFIEPLAALRGELRTGLSSLGAVHIYTREVANHLVTVVGETPAASVRRIADKVEFRRPQ